MEVQVLVMVNPARSRMKSTASRLIKAAAGIYYFDGPVVLQNLFFTQC